MERAAEPLLSGRYNVEKVAVEAGYHSLSHFSKVFQQVKGCLPSQFEIGKAGQLIYPIDNGEPLSNDTERLKWITCSNSSPAARASPRAPSSV